MRPAPRTLTDALPPAPAPCCRPACCSTVGRHYAI